MEQSDLVMLFEGRDGAECERFITSIRQQAFEKNKAKDDEWIATLAASRITGPALRWFETLDEEVQDSWKLLKRALLLQYPAVSTPSLRYAYQLSEYGPIRPRPFSSSSVIIPVPAAAAPPLTTTTPDVSVQPNNSM